MSVSAELTFGYALIVAGICTFVAPTLLSVISEIAPDASMKMGQDLAQPSIESRRRARLRLKDKISVLPNRGLIGVVFLVLSVPMFLSMLGPESQGIYVHLSPAQRLATKCVNDAIVITVKKHNRDIRVTVNGMGIPRNDVWQALVPKLSVRANWEVFVDADQDVDVSDLIAAVEIIRSLGAKPIILTPSLKKQLSDSCTHRLQVD
jgi:biopolymer transport protein ExbD